MLMLNLFEPLGSPAFNPSTVGTVLRPRCPEMKGKSVPNPLP